MALTLQLVLLSLRVYIFCYPSKDTTKVQHSLVHFTLLVSLKMLSIKSVHSGPVAQVDFLEYLHVSEVSRRLLHFEHIRADTNLVKCLLKDVLCYFDGRHLLKLWSFVRLCTDCAKFLLCF